MTTIIPVFNRPALLVEAVGSVLAQTYRPVEIIVVDDGSTDETSSVSDALATKHGGIIRVIHKTNGGPGLAREAGRIAARGDYIQHLDSDDLLLPRKFELQVAALEASPGCGAAYG
ncbi:MAG: glycosyltransferase family A protein, partial [Thermoanaerobaculia bacterium]